MAFVEHNSNTNIPSIGRPDELVEKVKTEYPDSNRNNISKVDDTLSSVEENPSQGNMTNASDEDSTSDKKIDSKEEKALFGSFIKQANTIPTLQSVMGYITDNYENVKKRNSVTQFLVGDCFEKSVNIASSWGRHIPVDFEKLDLKAAEQLQQLQKKYTWINEPAEKVLLDGKEVLMTPARTLGSYKSKVEDQIASLVTRSVNASDVFLSSNVPGRVVAQGMEGTLATTDWLLDNYILPRDDESVELQDLSNQRSLHSIVNEVLSEPTESASSSHADIPNDSLQRLFTPGSFDAARPASSLLQHTIAVGGKVNRRLGKRASRAMEQLRKQGYGAVEGLQVCSTLLMSARNKTEEQVSQVWNEVLRLEQSEMEKELLEKQGSNAFLSKESAELAARRSLLLARVLASHVSTLLITTAKSTNFDLQGKATLATDTIRSTFVAAAEALTKELRQVTGNTLQGALDTLEQVKESLLSIISQNPVVTKFITPVNMQDST